MRMAAERSQPPTTTAAMTAAGDNICMYVKQLISVLIAECWGYAVCNMECSIRMQHGMGFLLIKVSDDLTLNCARKCCY